MKFSDFIVEVDDNRSDKPTSGEFPQLKKAVERPDRFTVTPDTALNKAGTKPQAHKIVKQAPDGAFEIKQNRGHPEWTPDGFKSGGPIRPTDFGWKDGHPELDLKQLNDLRKNNRKKYDANPMNAWQHELISTHGGDNPEWVEDDEVLKTTSETHGLFSYENDFPDEVNYEGDDTHEGWNKQFTRKRTDDDDTLVDGLDKIWDYVHNSGPMNNFLRYGGYEEIEGRKTIWKKLSDINSGVDSELMGFDDEEMKTAANSMLFAMRQQQEAINEGPKFYRRFLNDNNDLFSNLKEGDVISDPGFMSSASVEKRPDWSWPGNTRMSIYGGKGRFNMPEGFTKYKEGETLFEPGTRLVFKGMKDNEYMFDQEGFNRDDFEEPGSELEEQTQPKSEDRKFGDMHFIIQKAPFKKYNDFKQTLDHDD